LHRPVLRTQAGSATIAFLESDRRDLPGADERFGDDAIVSAALPSASANGAEWNARRVARTAPLPLKQQSQARGRYGDIAAALG